MTVKVNGSCIGCGLCTGICPAVFTMLEEGVAAARDEIAPKYCDQIREAAESCPVSAIEIAQP